MRVIYSFGVFFYGLLIRLASLWNAKAKLWLIGRKDVLSRIENDLKNNDSNIVWIHSASLGEFEQGRPLIESLKQKYPELKIFLTFFSPSGYEIRKDYPLADYIYYLPEDTVSNARQFVKLVTPQIAVFIKYEYWYNYMNELNNAEIPQIFISGIFRPKQPFFKFYGGWFLNHLKNVEHFFVQNEDSVQLLKKSGIDSVSKSGDTRFDRVAEITAKVEANAIVEEFKNDRKLFLGGSTWSPDEQIIKGLHVQQPGLKIIIAPHLIDENHIQQIEELFPNSIRYSKAKDASLKEIPVLIIDNMGMLSSLYQYANFAMIGGGFGVGIHNTLEAATFGMPIFIGPNYQKFQEAKDLLRLGVVNVVHDAAELNQAVSVLLDDVEKWNTIALQSKQYVESNIGATQMILEFIENQL
ncbi:MULTISPECIES: 3-deoxy-D-manno-octulosonic acid transferase [unclassified Lentimicrobium]|uniref:3-deoxy-D-manno-octulosonic acid transferase n=1 Tax=unclassified Lentimicrobium TaxID=2677434 RepID=UPI0015539882|nr:MULTISPECIES: glycosyltransferase N-terminal domain-containing protein [unclassified Lentimicrobium]NPD46157.1 3-deoxy-D-manno-octulosonic acid transferase [Lentimicrobium sp. S6]NPD83208.1 3-deoxy-D-manno-octulosonic acid transferase [Lentimicrobium sp. L6]